MLHISLACLSSQFALAMPQVPFVISNMHHGTVPVRVRFSVNRSRFSPNFPNPSRFSTKFSESFAILTKHILGYVSSGYTFIIFGKANGTRLFKHGKRNFGSQHKFEWTLQSLFVWYQMQPSVTEYQNAIGSWMRNAIVHEMRHFVNIWQEWTQLRHGQYNNRFLPFKRFVHLCIVVGGVRISIPSHPATLV